MLHELVAFLSYLTHVIRLVPLMEQEVYTRLAVRSTCIHHRLLR